MPVSRIELIALILWSAACIPNSPSGPTSTPDGRDSNSPVPQQITPTPSPASPGPGLLIANGLCCAGGVAGEQIDIPVVFFPPPEFGRVAQMRACAAGLPPSESDLQETPWEPFTPEKSFRWYLPLNWTSFWVSVQYLAADGRLSPIYTAVISIEGMPAPYPPGQ